MKGIILLNGEPYSGKIDTTNSLVYCCDGAYNWAHGRVKIDENIGDFDSVEVTPYPAPKEVYPSEKDLTDGELALLKMLDKDVSEIEIYGGGGGREDHFLGNLNLLYLGHIRGKKCKMVTNYSEIFVCEGRADFSAYRGRTVSVLPFFGELHILSSKGLKYAYPEVLPFGSTRGISNEVTGRGELNFEGVAIIIDNGGKV